ncbi:MAG: HEPN domain-containing protein [Candidatus Aenigmarchaeota archaeon]|nr:HEPN domain-containing protein [Candidatus Aenigmarchaeota archaeon]MCX8191022.1 HEPN domain-containing protein [Candidatus Aenigmarchaeota archaeon]MDW8160322.1 HEPN domain-containing protein [Candidatus Aenigmarchaeota archaeon]
MGNKKRGSKIPALVWVELAKKDLSRAERAFAIKDYPDTVYRSQQVVEKMIKAILEINEIIVRDHYVSEKLKNLIKKREELKELEEVIEIARWFEKDKKWEITRYPLEKEDGFVLPEEIFTKEIAEESLKKAKFVFEKIVKIVKKEGVEV